MDVIGRGLSVSFRNFFCFALLAAVSITPLILIERIVGEWGSAVSPTDLLRDVSLLSEIDVAYVVVDLIGGTIFFNLLAAAVTFGTLQTFRQSDVRFGECLSRGLSRLLAVIGVFLWVMFVALLVPLLLHLSGQSYEGANRNSAALLFWIFALVIMFFFLVRYFVAVPIVIAEGKGVFEALSRSVAMTRGYRGKIFLIILAWLVLILVLEFFAEAAIGSTVGISDYRSHLDSGAAVAMAYVIDMLDEVLVSVFACVAYCELLRAEGGLDTRRIAAVFD